MNYPKIKWDRFCIVVLLCIFSVSVSAQTVTVKGKITDGLDDIPGATIREKGTTNGSISDMNGMFEVNVPEGAILVVQFVGFQPQEIEVNGRSEINVQLRVDVKNLEEVIVIGYGEQKKGDLTGAVSRLDGDALEQESKASFDNALQGRIAGVQVTSFSGQPGSASSVRIRGINSLGGNSQPLYVIDGVPLDNSSISGFEQEGGGQLSALADINPADIQSVEVLKDASSTAIYGALGSNGVILITTKKGKVGTPKLAVSSSYSLHELASNNFVDMIDSNDYIKLIQEAGFFIADSIAQQAEAGALQTTDWQSELYDKGFTSNSNISLSGGSEELTYYTSINYYLSDGIIPRSSYERLLLTARISAKVSPKFRLNSSMSINTSGSEVVNTATGFDVSASGQGGVVFQALRTQPTMLLDGSNIVNTEDLPELQNTPLTLANGNTTNFSSRHIVGNISGVYDVVKGLSYETRIGYNLRSGTFDFYRDRTVNILGYNGGWARRMSTDWNMWNWENILRYYKKVGGLTTQSILIFGLRETVSSWNMDEAQDFPTDATLYFDMGAGLDQLPSTSYYDNRKLVSSTARTILNYKDRYYMTLSLRADGASQFSAGNKWGYFPAASMAWRISNENFMKPIKAVNELKLRLGYGTNGNPATLSGQSLATYSTERVVLGENKDLLQVLRPTSFTNDELKWERTEEFNMGLDVSLFKARISITADAYIKKTNDLLLSTSVPAISGFTTGLLNVGSIENRGLELAINTANIDGDNFVWNSTITLTSGKTKITDLLTDTLRAGYNNPWVTGPTQRLIVGEELGAFWGFSSDGIYQYDDFQEFRGLSLAESANKLTEDMANSVGMPTYTPWKESEKNIAQHPGQAKFKDINEDGEISDADKSVIGRAQPDFVWSLNNTFEYKKFDLSIYIYGEYGRDMANLTWWRLSFMEGFTNTPQEVFDERWQPTDPSDTYPIPSNTNNFSSIPFSDRIIQDASFLRLKNVTFGYKFKLKSKITGRVYLAVQDALTLTRYKGYNPDVSLTGGNSISMGHDYGVYPLPITYTFGFNLNL